MENASAFGTSATCDVALQSAFSQEVHPFFRAHCADCHIEGGKGFGAFAAADVDVAFKQFKAKSLAQISVNAANDAHNGTITGGSKNKAAWSAIEELWPQREDEYLQCVSKSGAGGIDESLLTSGKNDPRIYSQRAAQTLTWDLDVSTDLDLRATRSAPVRASIKVQVMYDSSNPPRAIGYQFSEPTVAMKDGTSQVVLEGMYIYINRKVIASQTAYAYVSRLVKGTGPQILALGSAPTLIQPISTSDTIAVFFQRIVLTNDTDGSSPPAAPILTMSNVNPDLPNAARFVGDQARVTITRDLGVVRWCLTTTPDKPANTEAPCVGGTGPVNGWYFIQRPTQIAVPAPDGDKTYYLWVGNSSLKMNSSPGTYTVTRDTTPPAPATLAFNGTHPGYLERAYPPIMDRNSPNFLRDDTSRSPLGYLPIARVIITHPNENDVKGWCVKNDGNAPAANDACWRWRWDGGKPNNAPLPNFGNNNIVVFVRDESGNVSAVSNLVTGNNSVGSVTHSDLISNRSLGVFYYKCAECHQGSQSPGFQQLRLFELAGARMAADGADGSILVSRTNDPLRPMPNVAGGLMEEKYRQVIRIWARNPQ